MRFRGEKALTYSEFMHYIRQPGDTYLNLGDFNAHSVILDDKVTNSNPARKTIETCTN